MIEYFPGRIKRDKEWQLNEEGVLAIEFQRGRSHWITTEDGRSICQLEVYEADGKRRAGR